MLEQGKQVVTASNAHLFTKTLGEVEDQQTFRVYAEYRDCTGAVVRRDEAVVVHKTNPYYEPTSDGTIDADGMIMTERDGVRTMRRAAELHRTIGTVDTDQEWTCWVEYRDHGDPTVIHRSFHVYKKRNPSGSGVAGSF